MRTLIVTEFISLDGVIGEPQNWSFPYWGDDINEFKLAELFASDTMLLGRVTYEGFASSWPDRKGDPFSDYINSMEKVVVSNTLNEATWQNSHLLKGDLTAGITELKSRDGKDIVVHGGKSLVKSLLDRDLIDRWHLLVYPLMLGEGLKLFDDGMATKLRLVETKPFASGVVGLIYERGDS
jgi:dihydrofolate reductase